MCVSGSFEDEEEELVAASRKGSWEDSLLLDVDRVSFLAPIVRP